MAVESQPSIPDTQSTTSASSSSAIKVATPDLVIFQESALPVDALAQNVFEDLSANEIINISRSDLLDGKDVSYSLIGNLDSLSRRFNTNNIFSLPDSGQKYFKNFAIRFDVHVPEDGTGPSGQRSYVVDDGDAVVNRGDLVIDVIEMETNERVEVEILRSGTPLSDTIYVEES